MFIEVSGAQIYKTLIIVEITKARLSIHKLIAKSKKLLTVSSQNSIYIIPDKRIEVVGKFL